MDDAKDRVIIRITGVIVDWLVKVAPKVHASFVATNSKGMCVCVNSASTALSLCHDRVSTHRPVLSVPLGAAINKD